jgi:hypothetical protein
MKAENKKMTLRWSPALVIALLFCVCNTLQMAGGGSDTEVSGRIIASSGNGVAGAVVALIDTSYDPALEEGLPVEWLDTADVLGNYHFDGPVAGMYNVWAFNPLDSTQILISGITVAAEKQTRVDDRTLKPAATVRFLLPDSLSGLEGTVGVPGTTLLTFSTPATGAVTLARVPQGILSSIRFRKIQTASFVTLFTHVVIDSAGLFELNPYMAWQHEARISLNTTADGVNVSETLLGFPVLVRLTAADLDFSQARKEGEDLRFVRQDFSPLPFEIEYWDSATAIAAVWVRVDTVHGSAAVPVCRMLWGNPSARKTSHPAQVFDTADGFQGVWHLGESGSNNKLDATANGFVGTPFGMNGSSDISGVAGRAQNFDGSSQYIAVLNAQQSALDVQTDSFYTVSAWAYSRHIPPLTDNDVIVSKGGAQYGLLMNTKDEWAFFAGLKGYGVDTTTISPAAGSVWTHLAGVRKGMKQYLYVNGALVDSTVAAAGVNASLSNNFHDLVIGRQSEDGSLWFNGMIDEVRVENRARSAGWVRLCNENQKASQTLISIEKVR